MAMRTMQRRTASQAWRFSLRAAPQPTLSRVPSPPDLTHSTAFACCRHESLCSNMFYPSSLRSFSVLNFPRSSGPSGDGGGAVGRSLSSTMFFPSSFRSLSVLNFPRSSGPVSYSGGLHPSTGGSLGDLRVRSLQPLSDSAPSSAMMQQRRSLSKLKKYKIKAYSSYNERFRLMADGTYKRWRSGTRHNAHSKTPKQRRQLRKPSIAPLALAKVMKKLNFVR